MEDIHFVDQNGRHFVATGVDAAYNPDGATRIEPPPSPMHKWRDGEWYLPEPETSLNLAPLLPWQFWAMLRISGNENAVRDYASGLDEPAKTIALSQLEFSLEFRRDGALAEAARLALGLTDASLDALWDGAHQLAL